MLLFSIHNNNVSLYNGLSLGYGAQLVGHGDLEIYCVSSPQRLQSGVQGNLKIFGSTG